ncbi:NADdependent protein deacetylase, SIR2 family [Balamuthia mandrillaris]
MASFTNLPEDFDAKCQRAAEVIRSADIMLVLTGAGMSADSGLPVYRDIANVEAYNTQRLTYADLCNPCWLKDDPELFFGFWGKCFNDYRDTEPHEGYHLLYQWKEKYFSEAAKPQLTQDLRQLQENIIEREGHNLIIHPRLQNVLRKRKLQQSEREENGLKQKEVIEEKNEVKAEKEKEKVNEENKNDNLKENVETEEDALVKSLEKLNIGLRTSELAKELSQDIMPLPGPFYFFTSNVDAHSLKAGFAYHEVIQIHGNTEVWQCKNLCTRDLWKAPPGFRIHVDETTMRAPATVTLTRDGDADVGETSPSRPHHEASFASNHPRCRNCGALARPGVLMFGDGKWVEDDPQTEYWDAWSEAIRTYLDQHPDASLVLLEIGAGKNVPTVRWSSEQWMASLPHGACTLIRVNMDHIGSGFLPNERLDRFIGIKAGGLQTIQRIHHWLEGATASSKE